MCLGGNFLLCNSLFISIFSIFSNLIVYQLGNIEACHSVYSKNDLDCSIDGSFLGWLCAENGEGNLVKVFDNLVVNDTDNDVEAKFLDRHYILPRRSSFYMV